MSVLQMATGSILKQRWCVSSQFSRSEVPYDSVEFSAQGLSRLTWMLAGLGPYVEALGRLHFQVYPGNWLNFISAVSLLAVTGHLSAPRAVIANL